MGIFSFQFCHFKVRGLFFGSPNWEVHSALHLMEEDRVSLIVFSELMVTFLPLLITQKASKLDIVKEKHDRQ